MTSFTERSIGYLFGLLGGALLEVGGIVSFLYGAIDIAFGRSGAALGAGAEGLVLLVVGGLALFFAYLARGPWRDQPLASGILLVVTAAIGWGGLALGGNVLALLC